MTVQPILPADVCRDPVLLPVEAYVSCDYARAEHERLWNKVWLQAGRLEDIAETGSYMTYDIGDASVLIVRAGPDDIRAHANVCSHRGRRLVDTPAGHLCAQGRQARFVCGFHAWTYDMMGNCVGLAERQDWNGAIDDDARTALPTIRVDTWGGWVWISLDPEVEPLRDYLAPVPAMLDPFELEKMRYKWRKWTVLDCNWKVFMEAFNETYHVPGTHPEFMEFGAFSGFGNQHGRHSCMGYDQQGAAKETQAKMRLGVGGDPRKATARMQQFTIDTVDAVTTRTLVDAANRLVDELPEDTPGDEVFRHWIASAKADDAARGVVWPEIASDHVAAAASSWQVFPNFQIGHALTHALCYSARPHGTDPDKCVIEAFALERFPEGQAPTTEWRRCEPTEADFGPVLIQDFSNVAAVQAGMKDPQFRGCLPNPKAEGAVISLHRNLAAYMGSGEPRPIM